MIHARRMFALLFGLFFLSTAAPVLADPPKAEKDPALKKVAPTQFIRVAKDDKGQPTAMETSVVRYVPAEGKGVTVDLVGVVHVGDRAYYQKLNKLLDEYDVVLYELVAPEGTRIPKGGKRETDNPLAFLQEIMKMVLGLELQTEQIDYTKKHFVHADLSPEGMLEAMKNRGEDGVTLILGVAADFLRMYNLEGMKQQKAPPKKEPDLDLIGMLFDPAGPVKMKRMMAEQMAESEDIAGGLGQTIGTILIADRNKAALQVFQKELAKGKKKIAIFYGAGHMADFEKRLRDDYGLKKDSEQWLQAWDLRLRR